jgi:cyclase
MKKTMFLGAGNLLFERAKALRDNPTDAEQLLWFYLRQKPLDHKFRRQHPISQYVADFYCHSLKLIIEVDGDVHTNEDVIKSDQERQAHLEKEGINFLRFTNKQVEHELQEVIRKIKSHIANKK